MKFRGAIDILPCYSELCEARESHQNSMSIGTIRDEFVDEEVFRRPVIKRRKSDRGHFAGIENPFT